MDEVIINQPRTNIYIQYGKAVSIVALYAGFKVRLT